MYVCVCVCVWMYEWVNEWMSVCMYVCVCVCVCMYAYIWLCPDKNMAWGEWIIPFSKLPVPCYRLVIFIIIFLVSTRLRAVTNIQKITKSMKIVSAAKYARAEKELKPARPYGHGAKGKVLKIKLLCFSRYWDNIRDSQTESITVYIVIEGFLILFINNRIFAIWPI